MGNKFDFTVATSLVENLTRAAKILETKKGNLDQNFDRLGQFFQDDGYIAYQVQMQKTDLAVEEVIAQMKFTAQKIAEYAEKLYTAV